MASFRDKLDLSENDSIENVEMQERILGIREEQQERLLGNEDIEGEDHVRYKVEWHLRTRWAVTLSILIVGMVFAGLFIFTKFFVARTRVELSTEIRPANSFRRSPDEYILDPSWDFNAAPKIREYKWTITDIVGNPDGVFRPLLVINGQFPGPMIECNEGDTLVIEVDNQSVNATAIHFHGIFQRGTNWMDGAPGVTQCPISPRRKFTYKFKISHQAGTYYYHGHQAIQASDGLYGPLVIHSRDDKKLQRIGYVSDRVVMLQDYYHDLSSGLLIKALEPGSEGPPIPDGALINGLNIRDCSSPALKERLCDNSTASLPTFNLAQDTSHRFRVINVGALAWFQVGFDAHTFDITEVDGTDILPATEKRLMISPAQRYSLVVKANQTSAGDSFWLRARMVTHCWGEPGLPGPGADEVKAIVRYETPSKHWESKIEGQSSQPTSRPSDQAMEVQCKDMNTSSYIPAIISPPPSNADYSYYLRTNLEIGDWKLQRGVFNSSSFRPNISSPTLHRTIEGFQSLNRTFMSASRVNGVNSASYDLKTDFTIQHSGDKHIDLVLQNFDEGNHPMHLHGHKFWVLGQGHGMFPGYQSLGLQPSGAGILPSQRSGLLDNKIRRDVATLEGFGWMVLRFKADNPGVWTFHCHLAWHSEAGLVMQFLSRPEVVQGWEIPEENRRLCEVNIEELEKGSVPKDSIWYGFNSG